MTDAAPLRVLLVSQSAEVWGAERALLDLVPLLEERQVKLVLAGPPLGPFRTAWAAAGLQSVDLVLPPHRGVRHEPSGERASPLALTREATVVGRSAVAIARCARRFDLVQSESLWGHLETAVGGRLARRPVIMQAHDLVAAGIGRRLLQTAAGLSAATVAVSGAVAQLTGVHGAGHRTTVLHHGVDLDRFSPGAADPDVRSALGGKPDVPLVGILGRLDPEKGVDLLVRAMARLDGPAQAARLVVVGEGLRTTPVAVAELRSEAARLLGDRVRFVGRRTDIPAVMRSIDVLVSASTAEPFGLTILEAMASGTAVVAVATGGVPEIVDDGVTGLLVPAGNDQAMADAVGRACSDPELRARLGTRARAAVEAGHRREIRADRLVELYREVVARRGR